jgi:hypothetical protein
VRDGFDLAFAGALSAEDRRAFAVGATGVDREAARLGVLKNASMMRGVVGLATSTMVFVLSGTSALKTLP